MLIYVARGNGKYATVSAGPDNKYSADMYTNEVDGQAPIWVASAPRLSCDEAVAKADEWVAPPTK